VLVLRGRPALKPRLRVIPRVALSAGLALTPLAIEGWPVIARLVLSTALYLAALILTGALPAELRALVPDWMYRLRGRSV
jgi:hypothetical protein